MTQWGKKNVVEFYSNYRQTVKEMYESEISLLKKIPKKNIKSILDYGCAVGGFYNIFKNFFKNNRIIYFGLDYEKNVIDAAKKKFYKNKNLKFKIVKNNKIDLKSKKFSLTFSTGVLNHNKQYKRIIKQLIKLSDKYTFIDSPRIHLGNDFIGKLNLTRRFPSGIKKNNIVNNYTINLKKYLLFLRKTFKENGVGKVIFFYNRLPYKKRYLSINKKIFYLTFMCTKIPKNKKLSYNVITKDKSAKKIFKNILG